MLEYAIELQKEILFPCKTCYHNENITDTFV